MERDEATVMERLASIEARIQALEAKVGNWPDERLYTPSELSEKWGVSYKTVRRYFVDRDGVLKLQRGPGGRRKRPYVSLRIPESVAKAAYAEFQKTAVAQRIDRNEEGV